MAAGALFPVERIGGLASLQPANATGVNIFGAAAVTKRLQLLYELVG
jgi:hypothetical protein